MRFLLNYYFKFIVQFFKSQRNVFNNFVIWFKWNNSLNIQFIENVACTHIIKFYPFISSFKIMHNRSGTQVTSCPFFYMKLIWDAGVKGFVLQLEWNFNLDAFSFWAGCIHGLLPGEALLPNKASDLCGNVSSDENWASVTWIWKCRLPGRPRKTGDV